MSTQENTQQLNDRQARAATFFEQKFWETGSLATNEAAAEALDEKEDYIKGLWKLDAFRTYLITRGVNLGETDSNLLTSAQLLCANILLNVHMPGTVREKLATVKVSLAQYQAWMKQPAFRNYIEKRAREAFGQAEWEVRQSHLKNALDGDFKSIELFYEMTGIHTRKLDVNINVNDLLNRFVEVVQRRVDPATMALIADDLDRVLNGESLDFVSPGGREVIETRELSVGHVSL